MHAVCRHPLPFQSGIHWHPVDLLQEDLAASLLRDIRPTHLLHFAWYAVPGNYWTSAENLRWVEASLALARTFAECGGQRCVVAGTCAEYAWDGHDGFCREDATPLSPATLYGTSKDALRRTLAAFAPLAGFSFAWGRIFSLYGPYEHPSRLVASMVCALLRGEVAKCGAGGLLRDYLHVADVADAFVALLDSDLAGPVNIGSGDGVLLGELAARLGTIIGCPSRLEIGTRSASAAEPARLVADVGRLKALSWTPTHTVESGLAETIDWWRTELAAAG